MTEVERETLYWRISLIFLVLSPLSAWNFGKFSTGQFWAKGIFACVVAGSVVAPILFELLLNVVQGRGLANRVWIRHPTISAQFPANQDQQTIVAEVTRRLEKLSFQWSQSNDTISFAKSKDHQVHAFGDHAFQGHVQARQLDSGNHVEIEIVMNDILLVESGEMEKLRSLAEYLALARDDYLISNVPLITYCGLFLGMVATGLAAATPLAPKDLTPWIVSCSVGAFGMTCLALYQIRSNKNLIGTRIACISLYLAAAPFAFWALR